MKTGKLIAIFGFALLAAPASAETFVSENMVVQCAYETRAPGAYRLTKTQGRTAVQATETGTLRGAHDVNDCIEDKLQLQYGARDAALPIEGSVEVVSGCPRYAPVLYGGVRYCIGRR